MGLHISWPLVVERPGHNRLVHVLHKSKHLRALDAIMFNRLLQLRRFQKVECVRITTQLVLKLLLFIHVGPFACDYALPISRFPHRSGLWR